MSKSRSNQAMVKYKSASVSTSFSLNEPAVSYNNLDDNSVLSFISATRNGFSFKQFSSVFTNFPFSLDEWSNFLHVSERTMQRYKKENKSFEAPQSERILQIVLLNQFGTEIFGTNERFFSWLSTKNMALGGILPKSLLDNTFGIELLKQELGRIQHGVLA